MRVALVDIYGKMNGAFIPIGYGGSPRKRMLCGEMCLKQNTGSIIWDVGARSVLMPMGFAVEIY